MTIKIVREPEPRRVTCPDCKCELEYEFEDVTKKHYKDWDECSNVYYEIKCPRCKAGVNVRDPRT